MTSDYKKFKKKVLLEHVLKSALFGLAAGLTAAGVAIIGCFMPKDTLPMGAIIGITLGCGLGVFVLVSLLFFFLKKPKDTNIALRVDEDLKLQEKVTTMIHFENESGLIIEKQREDAKEKLAQKNTKALPVKVAVLNIPALIFGAAVFGASFATPTISKIIHTNKVKDPEHIDDDTKDVIDNIKNHIKKSGASKALQDALTKLLEKLQDELSGVTDKDERQRIVDVYKAQVDVLVNKYNTSDEIGAALEEIYKDKEDDLSKLLYKLAKAIAECNKNDSVQILRELEAYIIGDLQYDGFVNKEFCDILNTIADQIETALTNSQVEDGLELKNAFNTFKIELRRIAKDRAIRMQEVEEDKPEEQWDENGMSQKQANTACKNAFFTAIKEIGDALSLEETNKALGEEVKKLMDQLVDPKAGDSGDGDDSGNGNDDDNNNNNGENKDDDNGNNSGNGNGDDNNSGDDNNGNDNNQGNNDNGNQGSQGSQGNEGTGETGDSNGSGDGATSGKGDTKYPSNDKVFTGEGDGDGYQKYGDAIGDYNNDASNDGTGSSLGDAIGDYFDNLYGNNNP